MVRTWAFKGFPHHDIGAYVFLFQMVLGPLGEQLVRCLAVGMVLMLLVKFSIDGALLNSGGFVKGSVWT